MRHTLLSTNFNTVHSHLASWSSGRVLASCARGLEFITIDEVIAAFVQMIFIVYVMKKWGEWLICLLLQ